MVNGNPKVVSLLRGKAKPAEATVQLVEALRLQVVDALRERLNIMFEGADDLLFEFAERATNNQDRRLFFDTMRAVRLDRKNMTARFCDNYSQGFDATIAATASQPGDDGELRLQKNEAVELDIAVSNMATKADGLYKHTLWDIGGRIKTLVEDRHAPMSIEALVPLTICRAFRSAAETLNVGSDVELVVFKLFDRLVISELADLYLKVLNFLKQHGVQSAHPGYSPGYGPNARPGGALRAGGEGPAGETLRTQAPRGFADAPQFGQTATQVDFRAPAGLAASMMSSPALDPQSLASLQRLGATPADATAYSNASLAADLAAASQGLTIIGWTPRQSAAYVQRASLVGHMFNDILADPHLPNPLRVQFDGLRLSTMKVALKDIAFICDPDHPVRGLINELATMASTARTGGAEHQARIAELVSQIQQQFDIAAESLRKPPPEIELIDTDQAERFIEQQMAQTATRRQAIVAKVRRIIAGELHLRTSGTTISDEVRPLLNSLWAPMMAMHLLHHGPESAEWKHGFAELDQIVAMLDPARDDQRQEALRRELRAELETAFKAVGLVEARINEALNGFESALAKLRPDQPPADPLPDTAAAPVLHAATAADATENVTELLEQLVQPGAWFLVHDHDRNEGRWMKAVAYYAGLDCAAFAEFDGSNTLLLKTRMLLDDLLARRTVPVDLDPAARVALDRYLARAA
ncbi:MAG: DUF1631 family protein [Nevskia sp.]|nr:DUF1631 family protein [Nevskia sp.]